LHTARKRGQTKEKRGNNEEEKHVGKTKSRKEERRRRWSNILKIGFRRGKRDGIRRTEKLRRGGKLVEFQGRGVNGAPGSATSNSFAILDGRKW